MRIVESIPGFAAPFYAWMARTNAFMRDVRAVIVDDICSAAASSATMLDIGTGPGYVPFEIARRLPKIAITGIDLSPRMIDIARKNAQGAGVPDRVVFKVAHAARLPFADGSFDTLISTLSSHHWKNIGEYLRELGRVVKPGGRVLVYDFCRDVPADARRDLRRKYGALMTPLFLAIARTHSALRLEDAQRVIGEARFSRATASVIGVILKLELVK